jgi:hypothetical protein
MLLHRKLATSLDQYIREAVLRKSFLLAAKFLKYPVLCDYFGNVNTIISLRFT